MTNLKQIKQAKQNKLIEAIKAQRESKKMQVINLKEQAKHEEFEEDRILLESIIKEIKKEIEADTQKINDLKGAN